MQAFHLSLVGDIRAAEQVRRQFARRREPAEDFSVKLEVCRLRRLDQPLAQPLRWVRPVIAVIAVAAVILATISGTAGAADVDAGVIAVARCTFAAGTAIPDDVLIAEAAYAGETAVPFF